VVCALATPRARPPANFAENATAAPVDDINHLSECQSGVAVQGGSWTSRALHASLVWLCGLDASGFRAVARTPL